MWRFPLFLRHPVPLGAALRFLAMTSGTEPSVCTYVCICVHFNALVICCFTEVIFVKLTFVSRKACVHRVVVPHCTPGLLDTLFAYFYCLAVFSRALIYVSMCLLYFFHVLLIGLDYTEFDDNAFRELLISLFSDH